MAVAWRPEASSCTSSARNRRLRSDFLLVSVSTAQDWVPFRDVFEVDAQPIRDREQRLSRLFLNPSPDSLQQANRIQEESARLRALAEVPSWRFDPALKVAAE